MYAKISARMVSLDFLCTFAFSKDVGCRTGLRVGKTKKNKNISSQHKLFETRRGAAEKFMLGKVYVRNSLCLQ